MPTNLPPDYYKVEKRFREAASASEKVDLLEQMLSIVPKHKGTDHLRADLRRKLSKLREESQQSRKTARRDTAFHIPRAGAGQAAVIGPPNVGKSALVAALTGAPLEVSPTPYTTWEPTPAMMPVDNMQVQLIDTPPLSPEFIEPGLRDLLRRVDLLLPVVDLTTEPIQQLHETVELLEGFHIAPRHRQARYRPDQRMLFIPLLALVNKCDDDAMQEVYDIFCALVEEPWPCLPVSAASGRNLETLKWKVVEALDVIRVYTRAPGHEPDLQHPFVLPRGSRVAALAEKIHRDLAEEMKATRVWGQAVHDGQLVPRDYVLQEGDIVEIVD